MTKALQTAVGLVIMGVLLIGIHFWNESKSRRIAGTLSNGTACSGHGDCASDLCDDVCKAKKVNGEHCRKDRECTSSHCDERALVCQAK